MRAARTETVWVFVGADPPVTGGERYDWEIASELKARGYDCRVVNIALWSNLALGFLPGLGRLLETCLLAPWLGTRRGLFVLDEHDLNALALANYLRRWRGERSVTICHHMDRHRPGWGAWSAFWQRVRLASLDRVVAVSRFTRDELASLGLRDVPIVSPGCDPVPRRPHGPPGRPLRLLCVAPAEPRKGLDLLLEALHEAPGTLTVVGRTNTRHYRERLAPLRRGLEGRVRWRGRLTREEFPGVYADHDLLIAPSRREGFGIVVAEALQAGLPVVVSDSSALPELVTDNGLTFADGDAASLAGVLRRLDEETGLWERLREGAARPLDFSWQRCRREFLDVLQPYLE